LGALQNSLIPNLLKNTGDNLRYFDEFKIFELARIYISVGDRVSQPVAKKGAGYETSAQHRGNQDKLPYQPKMLAGVVVTQKDKNAFLELKGALEGLFGKLGIKDYKFVIPSERSEAMGSLDKEKFLSIELDGEELGWLGELKENIYRQFSFKNRKVALFEINFDKLIKIVGTGRDLSVKYKPLPQFPSIIRDLAFELNWDVKWQNVNDEILRRFTPQDDNLREVQFLSEFGLGDRKSVAFRIIYQADRTLKDEEVEVVEKKIIKILGDKFGARLRAALGK